MQNIILASQSAQRKKLLELFGLKFKIIPSHAKEFTEVTTTGAALVKTNALLKAQEVAERLNKGLVIGADSIVYVDKNNIIGKPKDLKEAKKNLKILFHQPHWVYTGVAVIDVASKKTVVDYEKTKVFMAPLTDKEIDKYHKKVTPFTKAGGFDIEGWGSMFIYRIEGCYTNVIGLPMAKLFSMLKKFGVTVLSLLFIAGFFGCSTEYNLATNKEERLLYGTDKEVRMGERVAAQIEKEYAVVDDVQMNDRVEKILDDIVKVCDREDIVFFVKVLDKDIINAVSLPGGYIYIFKGAMDKIKSDDELAGVIAHEVGHITARHAVKRVQAAYGAMIVQLMASSANSNLGAGVGMALNTIFMANSLSDEYEADRLSVKYLKSAGYKPEGIVNFLETIKVQQEREPTREYSYWKTHPGINKRISAVNKEIKGYLDFKDYVNLTGDE